MYTYMYYTILTIYIYIYFPLGKGVGLKACAGKNCLRCIAGSWSPSVDRMRITWAFWTLRLYKLHVGDMGYYGKWDMQVDSLKMIRYWWLCFLFTSWLQRKIHISPLFLRFFPGIVSCCRPSRVFWIHIDNLKEELTFQLLNFSLNFRPCHPQQTCAPLGMRWKDLHMDFAGVGNSLQAGFPPGMVQVAVAAVERAVADSS